MSAIATLRKAKGLTQERMAELLGIDQSTVSSWEVGRSSPRVSQLKAIAKALGCKPADLVA